MKQVALVLMLGLTMTGLCNAGGTLTPVGSTDAPMQIKSHEVHVVLNNGFARTEVLQTFYNPNDKDLEAIYAFPLPKGSTLSEFTIYAGEKEIHGEVLEKEKARQAYAEEKSKGRDTGLAEKNGFFTYQFNVYPVKAKAETKIRFVYYQSIDIDTGVGRYLYPLEAGGTDEAGKSFWVPNSKVDGSFSIEVELKSACPVTDVRVPGFEAAAKTEKLAEGHYKMKLDRSGTGLDKDFVFYYRLKDNLPGRVEVVAYRADKDKPGTFMMVVTPGVDLQPITGGADYTFILDVSGSMQAKLATLARGVVKALGTLKPTDRFRVIAFSDSPDNITKGWVAATPEAVKECCAKVEALSTRGGTNIYDALVKGLKDLDADRASSVILVTDGVANEGIVDPAAFHKLMKTVDVRMFGFLMGNESNWPLLQTICDATGGFYAGVSNDDDIVGQLLLAKSKITHECLHDFAWKISGVKVTDATKELLGKVYRGQQLVLFGKYDKGGKAKLEFTAKLTGVDKTYKTEFDFPDRDIENPEIERLWALDRIEAIQARQRAGEIVADEAKSAIVSLALSHQLVTDHTSMVVMSDEAFTERGIDRKNQERVGREKKAQAFRTTQPARDNRVDTSTPAFPHSAPSVGGGGGGALDPITGGLALGLAAMAFASRRRGRRETDKK